MLASEESENPGVIKPKLSQQEEGRQVNNFPTENTVTPGQGSRVGSCSGCCVANGSQQETRKGISATLSLHKSTMLDSNSRGQAN